MSASLLAAEYEQDNLDHVAKQMQIHMLEHNDGIDDKIEELIYQCCGLRYVAKRVILMLKRQKND